MVDHKEGCLYKLLGEPMHHRVPIDCVTLEGLLKRIKEQDQKILELKAKIYDAWERS